MSMYHLVHGVNPLAGVLLTALGVRSVRQIPRFRDCWWDGTYIALHTRTGGGNRAYYESEASCRAHYPEQFAGEDAPNGPWNEDLRALPGYVRDADDAFDPTYATFYYTPSDRFRAALADAGVQATDATPAQRWQAFFARLADGQTDPQVERVTEGLRPLFEALGEQAKER